MIPEKVSLSSLCTAIVYEKVTQVKKVELNKNKNQQQKDNPRSFMTATLTACPTTFRDRCIPGSKKMTDLQIITAMC